MERDRDRVPALTQGLEDPVAAARQPPWSQERRSPVPSHSQAVRDVMCLLRCKRQPPTPTQLLTRLLPVPRHKVPFRIVLTKGDLVHAEDLVRQHSMLHQELDGEFAHALSHGIYMVSSSTRAGIDTIQREITSVALNHARKLRRSAMAQSHAVVAKQAAPKTPKTPPTAPAAARTTNQTATKRAAKRPPSPSS